MDISTDNLRLMLELSRTGRLSDAASRLQVDETTLSRRIGRLEIAVGHRLFDRGRGGWQLTEVGRRLLPFAETIDTTLAAAAETLSSTSGSLSGTIRMLAPDGFGAYVLVPGLASFHESNPEVYLEVLTATSHDFLVARDFDLAVTLGRPARQSTRTERLAEYELGLYASVDYVARHGVPSDLNAVRSEHTIIWYVDSVLDVQPLRILDQVFPGARAKVQTNNIFGHLTAALCGVGIAPLPTYIGEDNPSLLRLLPSEFSVERTYSLVIPKQITQLGRIQAMVEALRGLVSAQPGLRAVRPKPGSGYQSP
ncbi:LysR family transcriptional regulator [Leucobacter weissii]|uniref:LysR family transcriptional regulator n=1 Tax=Leucobacter weissii TaxID=1983706 RepID=A0A939MQR8_9MICO|nr:LysR family transcriptional regulator [Leucobacter weissii]MBO1903227.1 LysR family transcriptional regulator [Leucobacter weissii]